MLSFTHLPRHGTVFAKHFADNGDLDVNSNITATKRHTVFVCQEFFVILHTHIVSLIKRFGWRGTVRYL